MHYIFLKIEIEGMGDKQQIKENIKKILSSIRKNISDLICKTIPFVNQIKEKINSLSPNAKKRVISGIIIGITTLTIVAVGGILYILSIFIVCGFMIYELVKMLKNIEEKNNKLYITLKKFGILYILSCCIALILIRESFASGAKITLWMFITIWTLDSCAYVFGKKFGTIKLAPTISPGKTYEGAILGSACALFMSIILYKLFGTNGAGSFSMISFVIFSIIVIILAQISDLSESVIKRQCEVKDSGTILAGHGGFLDRFDSFLIVAPFIYIILFANGGVLF